MENNSNKPTNNIDQAPDESANSLILARIEQLYLENGKNREDYQNSLEKLGRAINAETAAILINQKPPVDILKSADIEHYIDSNFTKEDVLLANSQASKKIIAEWLSIITRKNN